MTDLELRNWNECRLFVMSEIKRFNEGITEIKTSINQHKTSLDSRLEQHREEVDERLQNLRNELAAPKFSIGSMGTLIVVLLYVIFGK